MPKSYLTKCAACVLAAIALSSASAPAAAPAEEELEENPGIEEALLRQAHRIAGCTVTYYCPGACCNGSNAGKTASGMVMLPGVTCAVDPELIPLGADVLVDFGDGQLRYYKADDTGAGVRGAHVDLLAEDHEAALRGGITTATVYWIGAGS